MESRKSMKLRKVLAFLLAVCMVLTMMPLVTFADTTNGEINSQVGLENFSDVTGHWALEAIYKWAGLGVVNGDDKGFRPNDSITRAEMATILDNLMDYQKKAENSFSDVNNQAWYTDAVLKANAAGILNGDGEGHANPTSNITREQAAVMLARALGVDETSNDKTSFNDAKNISSWAQALVFGMETDKYIGGMGNGNFEPKVNVTRAQVVTMIDNAVLAYYTATGTYKDNVESKINGANCVTIVKVDGVTIKDAKLSGDLIIAEGVAQGNFTLDGTTVTGKLIARGGGKNSIHIVNGAEVNGRVTVERVDGVVRIVSDGVTIANLDASTEVVLEGQFTNVVVAEGAEVEVKGQVKSLSVEAKANITIDKDSTIESLTVQKGAEGAKVIVDGTVTNVKIEAPKTEVVATATAKITKVEATATATGTDISIDKKADIKTIESSTRITASGEGSAKELKGTGTIADKETGKSVEDKAQGLGGGGGGGNGSNDTTTNITQYQISGIVSLPNNEVAPEGGVDVKVSTGIMPTFIVSAGGSGAPYNYTPTFTQELINPDYEYTDVTILEGTTSAAYSLKVPSGKYTIEYNTLNTDYVEKGYYSSEGTVSKTSSKCYVDVNEDVENKDIELLKEYVISGRILLPNNEKAPEGGVTVTVSALKVSNLVTIPAGSTSVAYTLKVYKGNYKVQYNTSSSEYLSSGYYSTSGTVREASLASNIDVMEDILNKDIELAKGSIISGRISLPDNEVASDGGITITLYFNGDISGDSTDIIIPEGTTSAAYSLRVPTGTNGTLEYHTSSSEYAQNGSYSIDGTVYDSSSASNITVTVDIANKDIELLKGHILSGKVLLPNNEVAPEGGVTVEVSLGGDDKSSITISEGETSATYAIRVSPGTHKLSYNTLNQNYVSKGYYSTTGIVHSYYSASLITVAETATNVDIELEKGHSISGTISLPNNEVAPSGGIDIEIRTANRVTPQGTEPISTNVSIPEGATSVPYVLRVPYDTYPLEYWTKSNSDYISRVYYNTNGTTWDYSRADYELIAKDTTDRNIKLIKKYVVSGTVSLPNNEIAPSGGIDIIVGTGFGNHSRSDKTLFNTHITIQEGKTSAKYTLEVPSDIHVIGYLTQNSEYLTEGYYNIIGMVPELFWASDINVNKNISDIDLELLKEYAINGIVSLPNNKIAPEGGIKLSVGISVIVPAGIRPSGGGGTSCDQNNYRSTSVTIGAGTSSATYTLKVPEGRYKLGYTTSNSNYLPRGYFGTSGMVQEYSSASNIVISENVDNKNIELVEGYILSGTVSLPNNSIAPEGGITIGLDTGNNINVIYEVIIPEGETSASYSIRVPAGAHKLSYIISNPNYVSRGFYNTSGTTNDFDLSSDIMVNEDVSDKDIVILSN